MSLQFELASLEALLCSQEVDAVHLSGVEGDFGVFAGHIPFVTRLRPGIARVVKSPQDDRLFFIGSGFAEVTSQQVVVLAEEAFALSDMDEARWHEKIAAAQKNAQGALAQALKTAQSVQEAHGTHG